jgi:hypothetical protein
VIGSIPADLQEVSDNLGRMLAPLVLGKHDWDVLVAWAHLRFWVSSALEGDATSDLESFTWAVSYIWDAVADDRGSLPEARRLA